MADKIIKEIRYSESEVDNIEGNSLPRNFGKIFIATPDIVAIGQRIARKLNELKFISGEFDHIDINFTTLLKHNDLKISERDAEKWLKYIDYGLLPSGFNTMTDDEKKTFLNETTFKILKTLYESEKQKLNVIEEVENLINRFNSQIKINYKTKETNSYKIDITYQIKPEDSLSKAIVQYWDKKTNFKGQTFFDLQFYDDIYSLVDTIAIRDNMIILNPKKSFRADLYNDRYKTPLQFAINQLDKI
jgi:hypothetical protein